MSIRRLQKDNEIEINGKILALEDPIKDHLLFTGFVVVLLRSDSETKNIADNVFCLDLNGDLVWRVKNAYGKAFIEIQALDEKTLRAWRFDGYRLDIEVATGKTLDMVFSK